MLTRIKEFKLIRINCDLRVKELDYLMSNVSGSAGGFQLFRSGGSV